MDKAEWELPKAEWELPNGLIPILDFISQTFGIRRWVDSFDPELGALSKLTICEQIAREVRASLRREEEAALLTLRATVTDAMRAELATGRAAELAKQAKRRAAAKQLLDAARIAAIELDYEEMDKVIKEAVIGRVHEA